MKLSEPQRNALSVVAGLLGHHARRGHRAMMHRLSRMMLVEFNGDHWRITESGLAALRSQEGKP